MSRVTLKNFLSNVIVLLLFCCITFLVFYQFIIYSGFGDGDMFYHLAMAEQIKSFGLGYSLESLPLTSLHEIYINHHLGFHILLIPFILIFGSFWAAKIVHFGAVAIIFFLLYKILQKYIYDKRICFLVSLVPLTTVLFVSRMAIEKATAVAVAYSLFYIYVLMQKKYIWLLPLSFIYVFLYGGWPLLLFFVGAWTLFFWERDQRILKNLFPILYSLTGSLFAFIIHPGFPQNFKFYYQQIIQIALQNDMTLGFIASEWVGYTSIWIFLLYATVITFLFLGAVGLVVSNKNLRTSKNIFILCLIAGFLLLTIKSRRYIEYFVPYSVLSMIIYWEYFEVTFATENIRKFLDHNLKSWKGILIGIFAVLLVSFYGVFEQRALLQPDKNKNLFSYEIYHGAGEWVDNNISPGETIFHVMWEEFPMLWYYARDFQYISGLDPRFLLYGDSQFAYQYYNITNEKQFYLISQHMKQSKSDYIVVNKNEQRDLWQYLRAESDFVIVYDDDFAVVLQKTH